MVHIIKIFCYKLQNLALDFSSGIVMYFGNCSSDASFSHFLVLGRSLFKGTIHNKLPRMVLYRGLMHTIRDPIPLGNHLTDTTEELLINPLHSSIPQNFIKEQGTHRVLPVLSSIVQLLNVVIAGCL